MAVKEKTSSPHKSMTRSKGKEPQETVQNQLKIQLVRSLAGRPKQQREVVKGLGLRRINSVVIRKNCPEIKGMINKISHLLKVEVLERK